MIRNLHSQFHGFLAMGEGALSMNAVISIVAGSCLLGFLWALWNYLEIRKIKL